MIKELVEKLIGGENLTEAEAGGAMQELIDGADPHQAAALLVLLRAKGETPEELSGLAGTMRRHALDPDARLLGLLDCRARLVL